MKVFIDFQKAFIRKFINLSWCPADLLGDSSVEIELSESGPDVCKICHDCEKCCKSELKKREFRKKVVTKLH
jgi:hypothetical protein